MAKCALAGCNKKARKKFCCNKHKDRYHNTTNPRGKFAHLAGGDNDKYYYETTHPHDPDALGQWQGDSNEH